MMRRTILVLAVALVTTTIEARADMVSYNMTGTITYTGFASNVPFAVGDHISWTLSYDSSTPMSASGAASGGSWIGYSMPGYVLTNIADQTTGYHFPTISPSGFNAGSGLTLSNSNPGGYRNYHFGNIFVRQSAGFFSDGVSYYAAQLNLSTALLPTLTLAKLKFDGLPVVWSSNPSLVDPLGSTYFQYAYQGSKLSFGFTATVDSIPGAHMVPEPGSLTLFLLGGAGLAVGGMRRRRLGKSASRVRQRRSILVELS